MAKMSALTLGYKEAGFAGFCGVSTNEIWMLHELK